MTEFLITSVAFVGSTLAVIAGYSLIFDGALRYRMRLNKRVDDAFRNDIRERVRKSPLFKDLEQLASGTKRETWRTKLETLIEQSALPIRLDQLLYSSAAVALFLGVVGLIAASWLGALMGIIAGLVAPVMYVMSKRHKRINKLRDQLPEVFEAMGRSVRAGQTINGALQIVADDFESPVAEEFALCYEQQNLGISYEDALRDLARRSGIMELQIFVVSLLVQRKSGGNLIELLVNLAGTIRKRIKVQGKVKTLTSEGRLQAAVLIVLPVLVLVAVYFINRDYANVLLRQPQLLAGMLVAQGLGAAWIRKIVNVEY